MCFKKIFLYKYTGWDYMEQDEANKRKWNI